MNTSKTTLMKIVALLSLAVGGAGLAAPKVLSLDEDLVITYQWTEEGPRKQLADTTSPGLTVEIIPAR